VRRRRVEKAAVLLLANPARPITRVAVECGFSGPAVFARAFKDIFGMSASDWLRSGGDHVVQESGEPDRKNRQADGKSGETLRRLREVSVPVERILDPATRNWSWRLAMEIGEAKIDVRDVPEMSVAYLRHIGPYMGDSALFGRMFGQLFSWAGPRGLLGPQTKAISIYEDDPYITDPEKLRLDVAITVPAGTAPEGEIGMRTIPGGRYAVGYFELTPDKYGDAWDAMGRWLPESDYQANEGPCLEVYLNQPEGPDAKHQVEIYIPVKPQ
jgi:AraC family transcriptional regulator